MLPVNVDGLDYRVDVLRYPDNSTDFILSTADAVLGVLAMRLMAQTTSPTFVVGQAIPSGMGALFEGTTTRIIGEHTFAVNCVYQFTACERKDDIELTDHVVGELLRHAVANLSGYKGDVDTLVIMSAGNIRAERAGQEIHYMVGDVVFSKVDAPQ